jgi:hypothetical protein
MTNLIKLTNYPFSYSILTIMTIWTKNLLPSQELLPALIPVLGIAGFVGTFLAATDPLGRLIKCSIRISLWLKGIKITDESELAKITITKSGIESKAIQTEVNSIVQFLYFVIVIFTLSLAIAFSDNFGMRFVTNPAVSNVDCNLYCVRVYGFILSYTAMSILLALAILRLKELGKRVYTSGIHQSSINSDLVSRSSVENITSALERGDWKAAENWSDRITKEIQSEDILKQERNDRIQKHVETLLKKFLDFRLKSRDPEMLRDIRDFTLAKSFVSHLFTDDKNKEIYDLILQYVINAKEIGLKEKALKELTNSSSNLMRQIDIHHDTTDVFLEKNTSTGEWKRVGDFVSLLSQCLGNDSFEKPNVTKIGGSELFLVEMGNERIATLKEIDANNLSIGILSLVKKIRIEKIELERISVKQGEINQLLKQKIGYLLDAMEVSGEPLGGVCDICLTNKFHTDTEIANEKTIVGSIPWQSIGL